MEDNKEYQNSNLEEDSLTENIEVTNNEEDTAPAEGINGKLLLRKDNKLRRSLLKKVRPVAYHDGFKAKSLTVNAFIEPVLTLKVDRFAALMEHLKPTKNK